MFQNALPAVVLLILMVGIAWVLQRYRRNLPGVARQRGPALQVMNTLALGPQQRVVTVQVGQGEERICLVLGVAPGGITALHQMPLPSEDIDPTSTPTNSASGFAARLAQLTKASHGTP